MMGGWTLSAIRKENQRMLSAINKALLLGFISVMATDAALAQARCRVTDPTGTPLNIRATPNGRIIGTAPNGLLVTILDTTSDRGRPWALVAQFETGRRVGWVFREFISCF
jgi:hypothetical protein